MLRFLTSGESHGRGLVGIIEGMPAGLTISEDDINRDLYRRQQGYGRGGRMQIEADRVELLAGVRDGITLGSPISFIIRNQDYENWEFIMGAGECPQAQKKAVYRPRPGHADLAGAMKYGHTDMRNILERASARETAARVAAGVIFKQLLAAFNIYIYSQVVAIGAVKAELSPPDTGNLEDYVKTIEASPVRCADKVAADKMIAAIETARRNGESLGGVFEAGAIGVMPGLGSHVSWDRRMDSKLAGLIMSIPAIKAVEFGTGVQNAFSPGSAVHDQIYYNDKNGIYRNTNRAGGIEGGISNGEPIWLRAYMKPIPTLYHPLTSVNTADWTEEKAAIERSDICAVPAAAVVGESMLAYGLADALVEKFGGDSLSEMQNSAANYKSYLKRVWKWGKISY